MLKKNYPYIVKIKKNYSELIISKNNKRASAEIRYLNNSYMEEGTAQANGNRGGGHNRRASEESYGHSERSDWVPTSDYLGLKSHKQTCQQ